MHPLNRKLLRDIWRIKGQGLAIALVIASGVAMFVMSLGTLNSLEATRDAYYDRYRYADVFAHVKRAPEALSWRIGRIPNVRQVETRIVSDVILDVPGMSEPAVGRLISLPERGATLLNDVALRRGRAVVSGRANEVLASEAFADAHGLRPGDHVSATINERKRRLRIVGIVLSPEYIYSIAPGEIMPDDRRFGVLWMGRKALAAAFDMDGAFNDVSLALLPYASDAEVIDRLDQLLEPFGGVGAVARRDQVSNWYLENEMHQLQQMAVILPPIFLAVAAFLLNVVVARLIETEREQIGLLKAFGYGNLEVGWHYLKLVLAVTSLGIVVGFAGGVWLGRGLTEIYTEFFRFPFLHYHPRTSVFAWGALVSYGAALAGTFGAVGRSVSLKPAVAMMPAPPTSYHKSRFARWQIWRLIDQPTRMVLRHAMRWPLRASLTTLGIAMALALVIGSMFMRDSIEHIIAVYFHEAQRQDASVAFFEPESTRVLQELTHLPGVLAVEPYRTVPARLRFRHRSRLSAITGVTPDADLSRLLDRRLQPIQVPRDGLLLTTALAERLDAGAGDVLFVEVLEGRRPKREVPVVAVVEEYIGAAAYMDVNALNRLMREGRRVSGAHLLIDGSKEDALYRELKETPAVAGVSLHAAALETFRRTMADNLLLMAFFNVMFACFIACGVVYNSARIALSERGRELASLRVLGFTRAEAAYILLGELTLLTLLALPLGCLLGYGLAWLMSISFDSELYRIPLIVERTTYGFAILVVVLAAVGSGLVVGRRVSRLDLVAVLKTRE